MKLETVVHYLVNPDQLPNLVQEISVNPESEALLIYMKDALDLDSEISIFEIEETEDDAIFQKDGEKFYQLLPIEFAIELIESDLELKDKGYSNLEIAERLLEYVINDA